MNTGANYAAAAAASVGGIVALASGVDGRTDFMMILFCWSVA